MSDDDQVIESAELSELHRAVADVVLPERPPLESIIARGRGRRRNRQARAAGVAVAGLAAATVAVLGLTGAFAPATTPRKIKTAAFTLVSNVDGTATLTINPGELLDPAALQSDLAEYHVPAIVTAGKFCQSEPAPSGFSEVVRMQPSGGYTVAVGSGERPTITFDPNLTDKRFPGNPTQSFRSREPLRVVGELVDWVGHSPEKLAAMRAGVHRIGTGQIED